MSRNCNKNCQDCVNLNTRTDGQGYPFAWECLKYELIGILKPSNFGDSKEIIGKVK